MLPTDHLRFERARVPDGLWLGDPDFETNGAAFSVLCIGNLRELRFWNHEHVFDPFWRVYYNFTPGAYLTHGEEKITLGPDRFILMPANVLYETYLEAKKVDHLFLHFLVNPGLIIPGTRPLILPAESEARRLIRGLAELVGSKNPDRLFCYHRSLAFLHYLLAAHLADAVRVDKRAEVARVLQAIEAEPGRFNEASQLAEFAGMSLRNLQRHFQTATGQTPSQYLNEARLREAARRLVRTEVSIDQIATDLGFADRFHFSRLFRTFTGTPPAAFRRARADGGGNVVR